MKADVLATKDNKDIWTIAFDLQQPLPIPHIQTNVVFHIVDSYGHIVLEYMISTVGPCTSGQRIL
jgi:hypothetical protein